MRSFAVSDRFVADIKSRKLAPGYIFVGDEAFFRRKCREAKSSNLAIDKPELEFHASFLACFQFDGTILPIRRIHELPGAGAFDDVSIGIDH